MYKIVSLIFFITFIVILPVPLNGATLSLIPSDTTIALGETFTVDVVVESTLEAMNAASVMLSYPPESVNFISFSKKDSVFFLWPLEPVFSQALGTGAFEGFLLNPGYQGPGGHILSMTFIPTKVGDIEISFLEASVLANDGYGTELLTSEHNAKLTIVPARSISPGISSSRLPVPTLSSPTHPTESTWYPKNTVTINALLPEGVIETRTILSPSRSAVPTFVYDEALSQKTLDNVEDGVYYFSLLYKTREGASDTARFKVQIDTTPPENFVPTVSAELYTDSSFDRISFNATDTLSGISHFTITETSPDATKVQHSVIYDAFIDIAKPNPGAYTFEITAFDYAGNSRTEYFVYNSESIDESFHDDTRTVTEDTPLHGDSPNTLRQALFFLVGCALGLLISYTIRRTGKHKI